MLVDSPDGWVCRLFIQGMTAIALVPAVREQLLTYQIHNPAEDALDAKSKSNIQLMALPPSSSSPHPITQENMPNSQPKWPFVVTASSGNDAGGTRRSAGTLRDRRAKRLSTLHFPFTRNSKSNETHQSRQRPHVSALRIPSLQDLPSTLPVWRTQRAHGSSSQSLPLPRSCTRSRFTSSLHELFRGPPSRHRRSSFSAREVVRAGPNGTISIQDVASPASLTDNQTATHARTLLTGTVTLAPLEEENIHRQRQPGQDDLLFRCGSDSIAQRKEAEEQPTHHTRRRLRSLVTPQLGLEQASSPLLSCQTRSGDRRSIIRRGYSKRSRFSRVVSMSIEPHGESLPRASSRLDGQQQVVGSQKVSLKNDEPVQYEKENICPPWSYQTVLDVGLLMQKLERVAAHRQLREDEHAEQKRRIRAHRKPLPIRGSVAMHREQVVQLASLSECLEVVEALNCSDTQPRQCTAPPDVDHISAGREDGAERLLPEQAMQTGPQDTQNSPWLCRTTATGNVHEGVSAQHSQPPAFGLAGSLPQAARLSRVDAFCDDELTDQLQQAASQHVDATIQALPEASGKLLVDQEQQTSLIDAPCARNADVQTDLLVTKVDRGTDVPSLLAYDAPPVPCQSFDQHRASVSSSSASEAESSEIHIPDNAFRLSPHHLARRVQSDPVPLNHLYFRPTGHITSGSAFFHQASNGTQGPLHRPVACYDAFGLPTTSVSDNVSPGPIMAPTGIAMLDAHTLGQTLLPGISGGLGFMTQPECFAGESAGSRISFNPSGDLDAGLDPQPLSGSRFVDDEIGGDMNDDAKELLKLLSMANDDNMCWQMYSNKTKANDSRQRQPVDTALPSSLIDVSISQEHPVSGNVAAKDSPTRPSSEESGRLKDVMAIAQESQGEGSATIFSSRAAEISLTSFLSLFNGSEMDWGSSSEPGQPIAWNSDQRQSITGQHDTSTATATAQAEMGYEATSINHLPGHYPSVSTLHAHFHSPLTPVSPASESDVSFASIRLWREVVAMESPHDGRDVRSLATAPKGSHHVAVDRSKMTPSSSLQEDCAGSSASPQGSAKGRCKWRQKAAELALTIRPPHSSGSPPLPPPEPARMSHFSDRPPPCETQMKTQVSSASSRPIMSSKFSDDSSTQSRDATVIRCAKAMVQEVAASADESKAPQMLQRHSGRITPPPHRCPSPADAVVNTTLTPPPPPESDLSLGTRMGRRQLSPEEAEKVFGKYFGESSPEKSKATSGRIVAPSRSPSLDLILANQLGSAGDALIALRGEILKRRSKAG